jgi:4-aminobutyrate aminotransferase-like enzyme/Ser/Thr protein kinase RdoA (MazF antagonist)/murein DD-endopeptidase MepM/ murein hydrolase activator NlpD
MTISATQPAFTITEIRKFCLDLFGLKGEFELLPSERDQNIRITAEDGEKFVLKISNATEEYELLDGQNQVMAHLDFQGVPGPMPVAAISGKLITKVTSPSGRYHYLRLVTYLEGTPYGNVAHRTDLLYTSLGEYLGKMDQALLNFSHPSFERDFQWDIKKAPQIIAEQLPKIKPPEFQEIIQSILDRYHNRVCPVLPQLRKSLIHNDANDYNVIVKPHVDPYRNNQIVTGIIDYGDMIVSYTIANLAIAIAYAILDQPDHLSAAIQIFQAYHQHNPLTETEISVLFDMVCLRLGLSACIAAQQVHEHPENEYLNISQAPIRNTLPKFAQIPPDFMAAAFRAAIDLKASPKADRIVAWLTSQSDNFAPIMAEISNQQAITGIDLHITSSVLDFTDLMAGEPAISQKIFDQLSMQGAHIGAGGYDEARLLYVAPPGKSDQGPEMAGRTVHLGCDLFVQPGTAIFAPVEGKVHSFSHNQAPFDYGPVIILEHQTYLGDSFYTIFGHLSLDSIANLKIGQLIQSGEEIGAIGASNINGGWTPHLHFQIITNLFGLDCDFPGVCKASHRELWKTFSPDPNLILNLPAETLPQQAIPKNETLDFRQTHIGPNLSLGYHKPIKIERGWRQYLYDDTGRRFIDAYNNVPHVGHCHPRVIAAGRKQMGLLNTNTRYLHDLINIYAEAILATLPEAFEVCFFVNSGSEANELALRIARAYTQQKDMIVMAGAYHGNTTTLTDLSPYKHAGPGGSGPPDWVHIVPIPDLYRGVYRQTDPMAAPKYAAHLQEITEILAAGGKGIAGFIAETCPSVSGQIFLPPGYLELAYTHTRAAGGICITDEVQTGYGRIGTHFYAFEDHNVVPDIVVLGKPIGNGHPIGVVVTTREIAAAFDNGMEFFSTFGGNPVSCAIGKTVLEVVQDEGLQSHALAVGNHLRAGLYQFKDRYPIIGDVRGSGLFLGVELVSDHETLEPAAREASFIANRMMELGILLGTDGPHHNVIKIRPPMPFDQSDADILLTAFEQILQEDFS